MTPLSSRNGGGDTKSASASSASLTPLQLQRVNEAFHELYGYPFSTSSSSSSSLVAINQESSATTVSLPTPPPDWLYTILGNHSRQTQRVWQQLSPTQQQQWTRRRWCKMTGTIQHSKTRKVVNHHTQFIMKSQKELRVSNHKATKPLVVNTTQHDLKNATTVAPTQPSITTRTTANITTRTNDNIPTTKTNMTSLLQQLDGHHQVTTMTKTALDWEQYKQQQPLSVKAALEEQATSSTAYLPQQEFLQRVDLRKYQQEKQERLSSQQQQQGGKK